MRVRTFIGMLAMSGLLAAGLTACQTTQSETATKITNKINEASGFVKQVQAYASQVCAYLPTAATVVGIFNSGFSADVAAIGGAICNAVTTVPKADGPGDHKPRVNGVVIRGRFVH